MPVSDPVADLLTRIRNANSAHHDSLEVDSSKLKIEIVTILHEEGYIKSYEVIKQPVQDKIKVTLKYGARNREKVITDLKRISKPGLRVYRSHDKLPDRPARPGHRHRQHLPGRDDRQRRPANWASAAKCWRSFIKGVYDDVTYWQTSDPAAAGR